MTKKAIADKSNMMTIKVLTQWYYLACKFILLIIINSTGTKNLNNSFIWQLYYYYNKKIVFQTSRFNLRIFNVTN